MVVVLPSSLRRRLPQILQPVAWSRSVCATSRSANRFDWHGREAPRATLLLVAFVIGSGISGDRREH